MNDSVKQALVVDDILVNRKLAVALLGKLGWGATDVDGGVAALDWVSKNPPVDLLLLDIGMPDINGEELCRQLRTNPAYAKTPIVAYTAHALSADIQRYLLNGFDAVLIKPVSLQGIRDVLTTLAIC